MICGRRFLERDIQRTLAALARCVAELGDDRRLAGAGRTADQHRTAAVDARSQHAVEAGDAGRDALLGDRVLEPEGGDREN
jgi:hypothetical protein